jgi:hypothetical protein
MKSASMKSNVLMFSIGLNGYDIVYSNFITSQRLYAKKNFYEYLIVTHPLWNHQASDSSWLKIPLILAALRKGYEWVFFIDADCDIRLHTPRLESIEVPGKYLYLANGYTGRVNAGVIIVKNTAETQKLFESILEKAETSVPRENQAPYENGHVIHYSKGCEFLQTLDLRWNNNMDKKLNDYIRHYSNGSLMRKHYKVTTGGKIVKKVLKFRDRMAKAVGFDFIPQEPLKSRLATLTWFCQKRFPAFSNNGIGISNGR